MKMRKFFGFLVGFIAVAVGIVFFASVTHLQPRGAGWLFLMILGGIVCKNLFAAPEAAKEGLVTSTEKMRSKWWELEKGLRLIFLVSLVWIALTYFIQDSYERNLKIVFFPVFAMFALYFGHKHFVAKK